jgi:predicted dehydrogenase
MTKPMRVAIIGMGGFAGTHHDVVAALEASGEYRLIAACDPAMDKFAERQQTLRFAERGVRLFTDYLTMLEACRADLDVVTIPTPIPLHAPMHQACVDCGLSVYLEKPPTLDPEELERMIAVDARAPHQTTVGFNFIIEPERQALKRRLVAGEFGRVKDVTASALWPRNATYFGRADWAGRLQKNGRLVLDSCIGNAMAHQVHNALFWCGIDDPWAWGEIERVEAELYRAHNIEGMDTAFVAATTRQGVPVRVGMTHACHARQGQEERVVCERALIRFHINNSGPKAALYSVTWNDGRVETGGPVQRHLFQENFRVYAAYLCGEIDRPATRLIDSRPFVHLNNLAYIASRTITTVKPPHVTPAADGYLDVAGLPEAIDTFMADGRFPSAQQRPWARPGRSATPADLPTLETVVRAMVAAKGSLS